MDGKFESVASQGGEENDDDEKWSFRKILIIDERLHKERWGALKTAGVNGSSMVPFFFEWVSD